MFGLSLHDWEHAMLASLVLAAVFAALVAFSTYCVVMLQRHELSESEERIENLRAQNLALEEIIAPRSLTPDETRRIIEGLSPFSGRSIAVESYTLDTDGAVLALQLMPVLKAAGIDVKNAIAGITPMGSFIAGVLVSGKDDKLVDAIVASFNGAGRLLASRDARPLNQRGARLQTGEVGEAEANSDAAILIGVKPPPHAKQ